MQKSGRLMLAITLAGVLMVGAGIALVLSIFLNVPEFASLRSSVRVPIHLKNGTKTFRWVGPKAPGWVDLPGISESVILAVIASEDTSFFSHKGIDPNQIKEAIKRDLKEGKWARGASTLTQQLIKNVYLDRRKSIWRKVKEILWARELEKQLSKPEILCFYLNMAEWGPGLYGISEASRYYFSIAAIELTPKQSAFLAMLLPSPVKYHGYFARKQLTPWADKRIRHILKVMNGMGFMDAASYEVALAESLWEESVEVTLEEDPGLDEENLPEDDPMAMEGG